MHRALDKKPITLVLECTNCGAPVVRSSSQVAESGRVFCPRCPKNGGENHYKWKEGQYLNHAGYRMILVNGDYVLEHIYVWEKTNRAKILKEAKAHVHHVDMVKTHNYPDNLLLLADHEHGRVHKLMKYHPLEAYKLLDFAGKRQLWYPKEIQNLGLVNS